MNVFVQRVLEAFELELDHEDAVKFAQGIVATTDRMPVFDVRAMSVPAKRELNLALVFLQTKYPFQCCGKRSVPGAGEQWADDRCQDCPMRAHDL